MPPKVGPMDKGIKSYTGGKVSVRLRKPLKGLTANFSGPKREKMKFSPRDRRHSLALEKVTADAAKSRANGQGGKKLQGYSEHIIM